MNMIFSCSIFLMSMFFTNPSFALLIEELVNEAEINIIAEVISPCGFELSNNSLSFNLKPSMTADELWDAAQAIQVELNCPNAKQYEYAFESPETARTDDSANTCAKGLNGSDDNNEYTLFCIRDNPGLRYNVVKEAIQGSSDNFKGNIPESGLKNDIIWFFPNKVPSIEGRYTGVITLVLLIE